MICYIKKGIYMDCSIIITKNEKGVSDAPLVYKNQATAEQTFIFHIITTIQDAIDKRYFPNYIKKFAKKKQIELDAEKIICTNLASEFLQFMTETYACTYDATLRYFNLKAGQKRIEISMFTVPTGD